MVCSWSFPMRVGDLDISVAACEIFHSMLCGRSSRRRPGATTAAIWGRRTGISRACPTSLLLISRPPCAFRWARVPLGAAPHPPPSAAGVRSNHQVVLCSPRSTLSGANTTAIVVRLFFPLFLSSALSNPSRVVRRACGPALSNVPHPHAPHCFPFLTLCCPCVAFRISSCFPP